MFYTGDIMFCYQVLRILKTKSTDKMYEYFLVGVSVCASLYFVRRLYVSFYCMKNYDYSLDILNKQFDVLALFLDKDKIQALKNKNIKLCKDFTEEKIAFPEFKKELKTVIGDVLDLFDDYYKE